MRTKGRFQQLYKINGASLADARLQHDPSNGGSVTQIHVLSVKQGRIISCSEACSKEKISKKCFREKIEVKITKACAVGSNIGEHKGIGRNRSFIDPDWAP